MSASTASSGASRRPRPNRSHHVRDAALLTVGLSVSSAVGYVAVASSRTRRRIRLVEQRYGQSANLRLL
ncbi:hypothetical protein [Conexibacter sp. SYSU D00693]|uniref:hypothetical protein n=1 Tax=Conexibacter sp. SYSU D00693 TaxID=2812560 RepID=UPI00196B4EBE|nr:hypothetical protein [Conexibacter sp. SYSU D00693]